MAKLFRRSNIGSVSSGTMRNEDLIDSFVYELRQQRPLHREHCKLIREIEARYHAVAVADDDYFDTEDASEGVNDLIDALNAYAPEGFYFGSHPGDGADFGFWLSDNFIESFDGLRVEDTSEVPANYTGQVLHVNDHGNVSLYYASKGRRLREIWAIA